MTLSIADQPFVYQEGDDQEVFKKELLDLLRAAPGLCTDDAADRRTIADHLGGNLVMKRAAQTVLGFQMLRKLVDAQYVDAPYRYLGASADQCRMCRVLQKGHAATCLVGEAEAFLRKVGY